MLRHYRQIEIPQTDGSILIDTTNELVDDLCVLCGGESVANSCPGDGRSHYHGRVHRKNGGLVAICASCIGQISTEWNERRR